MKSLRMSKVFGTIKKKKDSGSDASAGANGNDSPEAIAARSVISFCESGGPNNSGDEVLYLPPIVDAAESSPAAAAECARLCRKYLKKDYWSKPSYQYNSIMLIRILADNPGPTFTRNLDQKFTDTAKELLKSVRDPSVRQMMMETLDAFENTKAYDEGLGPLIDMWKKEKEKAIKQHGTPQTPAPQTMNAPPFNGYSQSQSGSQNYFARSHQSRKLPSPVELASRLEEARTSANLLDQVLTSTPPAEVLDNDLIKEFADRCSSASQSIQNYMNAENPVPDNDTMESLIDTNEQLQAALSLHQRAMLNARKQVTPLSDQPRDLVSPMGESERNGSGFRRVSSSSSLDLPSVPPRKANGKGKQREYEPALAGPSAGPSRSHTPAVEAEDPFRDPVPEASGSGGGSGSGAGGSSKYVDYEPTLAFEPFHPGFDTTPSYLGRQESALGNEAMHGAVDQSQSAPSKSAESRRTGDNSEVYDATPLEGKKEPMYRY
ncbi:Uu.00g109890.m01.CDS01 [Anthostomella pinea]|uniref:Uu.00g109890.m01.CDS01 n=1 Tax=Anthostomella pinea TaxID=933095 RepID=A0AAI8VFH2_9PEZI|nr:Uu.00g109890.m01.CDS01 [Anthostomella pinea]